MLKKSALGLFAAVFIVNIAAAAIYLTSVIGRDLSIPETAIEFQEAVYGGNYEAMWELSAEPYRGGRTRDEFIEWARHNTPPATRVIDWTVVDEHTDTTAQAHTRIQLSNGEIVTHLLLMTRTGSGWKVTHYEEYSGDWPPDELPLAPDVG